jgi:hypothetical protein
MGTYDEVLSKYPSSILDVSVLPLSKTDMKIILKALYTNASNEEQKKRVQECFMRLSFFHDGVGPAPIDKGLIRGDLIENLDANIDIIDRWTAWQKLLFADAEILLLEWKQFMRDDRRQ